MTGTACTLGYGLVMAGSGLISAGGGVLGYGSGLFGNVFKRPKAEIKELQG